MLPIN
ncbi:hypothetical protein LINPERPRIM_LOCUS24180 [Linum perenne]